MGPKKKKEKLTKAQKSALKKEKEEQLRKEAEEAQRLAEIEEKRRQEEEQLRLEELERIRLEEAEIREKQQPKLLSIFQSIELIHKANRSLIWEEWEWHCYVNEWKTINPLSLPMVNSFLSEWDEQDESYEMKEFFSVCHSCLDIIQQVETALLNCPDLDPKTESNWKEIQMNLKRALNRKFDVIIFLLLRDAISNISQDSYNMEYGVVDTDFLNDGKTKYPQLMVFLWANFVKNIRYKGMELLGRCFEFELPDPLVKMPCAVQFLRIPVDTVSIFEDFDENYEVPSEYEELIKGFRAEVKNRPEQTKMKEAKEVEGKQENAGVDEQLLSSEQDDKTDELIEEDMTEPDIRSSSRSTSVMSIGASTSTEAAPYSDVTTEAVDEGATSCLSSTTLHSGAYKPKSEYLSPSTMKEKSYISYDKYFLVGGIFHFEMLAIPYQPVEIGSWVMTLCEDKKPIKIPYQTSITPIRQPLPEMSLATAAEFSDSEIKRFEKEMASAIHVSFCLPKDVIFLEKPVPAIWEAQNCSFRSDGFFDISLDEENDQISFKIERFGKIGLFQRKYANHPFESWELSKGDAPNSVRLLLIGTKLTLDIIVDNLGCFIKQICTKDEKDVLQELYDISMTPNRLMQKLLSVGICIMYDKNGSEQIKMESKQDDFESWTHMCMSIICTSFTFSRSKWNHCWRSDGIVLCCRDVSKQEDEHLVLMTPERAYYLKVTDEDESFSDAPEDNQKGTRKCTNVKKMMNKCPFEKMIWHERNLPHWTSQEHFWT